MPVKKVKTPHQWFMDALEMFNSGAHMAEEFDVTPAYISQIKHGARPVSTDLAKKIDRYTAKRKPRITKKKLRPDIYD